MMKRPKPIYLEVSLYFWTKRSEWQNPPVNRVHPLHIFKWQKYVSIPHNNYIREAEIRQFARRQPHVHLCNGVQEQNRERLKRGTPPFWGGVTDITADHLPSSAWLTQCAELIINTLWNDGAVCHNAPDKRNVIYHPGLMCFFSCMACLSTLWLCLLTLPLVRARWGFVQARPSTSAMHTLPPGGSAAVVSLGNLTALPEGISVFHPGGQLGLAGARWQFRGSDWCLIFARGNGGRLK